MQLTKSHFLLLALLFLGFQNLGAQNLGACGPVDYFHAKVLDQEGHLDSWHKDGNGPFHTILSSAAQWWEKCPDVKGWPAWCTAAELDRKYNPSNGAVPGSACSMAIISSLKYYLYSGDSHFLEMARRTGDYIVRNDLTSARNKKYPQFAYAVGKLGDIHPDGSGHPSYDKKFNPPGHIQPDKGAMLGFALLQLYKTTGKKDYLKTAIHIADCLAENAASGNADNSPWPMRVMAENNELVDGKLDANISFACRLFDGLLRLGEKGNGKYEITKKNAWDWLKNNVIPFDDGSRWENFFEDHGGNELNSTQINALETVRYLLEEKERADPDWFQLSGKIINQVLNRWALTTLQDHGYICIAEQDKDKSPYNSHTARLGSILAMYYALGAEQGIRDLAYASLCYGMYSVEDDGFASTYYKKDRGAWTSDSFGDFIGHYLDAFSAIPEWAGNANHLLKSSGTIKNISYKKGEISYSAFENSGTEMVKLTSTPQSIYINGKATTSFQWDELKKILRISRVKGSEVKIRLQ